ncbi:MAG TPA: hypothetical protein VFJ29_07980, partial [Candidatus Kapabacteria bacterium]|nr:hypothetical protein [Candidatus Kapabacteria bacterium]
MADEPKISELLLHCEETGAAPPYGAASVQLPSNEQAIYVISDLHIGAGQQKNATYTGTENFYADDSLFRFLREADNADKGGKSILVINGDFVDFLRIMPIPKTDEDFTEWAAILANIGISQNIIADLRKSISKKEVKFGLKTHDYKSVWKLHVAVKGH